MIELLEPWRWRDAKHSYAQAGEDLIVDFIAKAMQIDDITYLDIGAHHPTQFSNTYLFYKRGFRGVLVEPDPELMASIRTVRPHDVCIEAGVGVQAATTAQFFVMSTRTLNTFSEDEAKRYEAMGTQRIEKVLSVPLVTLDHILADRFGDREPILMSIDIEGLDFEVLSTLNLKKYRPPIVCIETLKYSETREETKDARIAQLMSENGYFVYGDTYINTIFVDIVRWRKGAK
jgi:FkbM family methyltransferase